MVTVLGLDPGSHLGYVVVAAGPPGPRILAHGTIGASAAQDGDMADRATFVRWQVALTDLVAVHGVTFVVAEQPVDAKPFWSAQKGRRREGTGTAFRSGVYYGLLRAAIPAHLPFISYPVHRYQSRVGWMPARAKRDLLLHHLKISARASGAILETDHECMAFGVALHGLTRWRPTPSSHDPR